jgi:hypothetical protein
LFFDETKVGIAAPARNPRFANGGIRFANGGK